VLVNLWLGISLAEEFTGPKQKKREREKIADNICLAEAQAQILMQHTKPLAQ